MSPTTLVVQYHPLEDSFGAALLGAVAEALDPAPEVVRLGQGEDVDEARLATAERLIVVAPTWWGAMPARVLAWIQAKLGPWIDGDDDRRTSPLRSVERLAVVTTHGSSRFINGLQGEPGRHLWKRTVLPLCADGARFDWIALYKLDRLDQADREAFLDRVGREIRGRTS
jgi:putative NADPH-quinone reductase